MMLEVDFNKDFARKNYLLAPEDKTPRLSVSHLFHNEKFHPQSQRQSR